MPLSCPTSLGLSFLLCKTGEAHGVIMDDKDQGAPDGAWQPAPGARGLLWGTPALHGSWGGRPGESRLWAGPGGAFARPAGEVPGRGAATRGVCRWEKARSGGQPQQPSWSAHLQPHLGPHKPQARQSRVQNTGAWLSPRGSRCHGELGRSWTPKGAVTQVQEGGLPVRPPLHPWGLRAGGRRWVSGPSCSGFSADRPGTGDLRGPDEAHIPITSQNPLHLPWFLSEPLPASMTPRPLSSPSPSPSLIPSHHR